MQLAMTGSHSVHFIFAVPPSSLQLDKLQQKQIISYHKEGLFRDVSSSYPINLQLFRCVFSTLAFTVHCSCRYFSQFLPLLEFHRGHVHFAYRLK